MANSHDTMTHAEIARRAGLARGTVTAKLRRGMTANAILAAAERAQPGSVDFSNKAGRARVSKNGKRMGRPPGTGTIKVADVAAPGAITSTVAKNTAPDSKGNELTQFQANLRKAIADAERSELDLRIRSGEMAPIGQIKAFFGGAVIHARDILLGLVDLADRIRQAPDIIEARALIDTEVRRALTEVSKYRQFVSGDADPDSADVDPNAEVVRADLSGHLGISRNKKPTRKLGRVMGKPKKRGV